MARRKARPVGSSPSKARRLMLTTTFASASLTGISIRRLDLLVVWAEAGAIAARTSRRRIDAFRNAQPLRTRYDMKIPFHCSDDRPALSWHILYDPRSNTQKRSRLWTAALRSPP